MPLLGEKLQETNRRHWLHAIWLQIRIRITYFFDQWAGIKPVFMGISGYKSKFRPKNCPDYDIITRLGFVFIWLFAAALRECAGIPYFISCKLGLMSFVNACHKWLSDRLESQFKAKGYTEAQREVPIPEYDWAKGSPEEFYELFVKVPHPVILRGFMNKTDLTKTLTWKNILKKYGEEDVFLTKKELDGFPGKLKDVEDPAVYLHNSEKLFNKYPEIRDLFQYERLEDFLTMKVGYEQLFIGKEGTGTPFHNAAVYNMFYMIDGKKKWWFIDPYDTFLAYPVCVLGRAASIVGCLWPHQYNVEAFPLFKYCPVYYAEVGPGDVLFNPPWWWHSIKNSSPHTVGVASRWHTDGIVGHKGMMSEEDYDIYRFGSFAFLNGLSSWSFLHGILQEPSPKYDEHATLRETNNRFVHKQHKISEAGGIDVGGVKTKF